MATPEERIKERLKGLSLDQAPEPDEPGTLDVLQELATTEFEESGDEDLDRIRQRIRAGAVTPEIRTPRESGLAGFGKGFVEGVTDPLTIFGLDADLPPGRVDGFPMEPAGGSRVLGTIAGTFASIAPYYLGAHVGLKASGLAGAMSQAEFQFARGAIAGGLFEAGFAEEPEEIPGRFALGATAGGAIDLALFGRAVRKARVARGQQFDEETAQRLTDMVRRASERSISRRVQYESAREQVRKRVVDTVAGGDEILGPQIFNEHGIATGVAARGGGGVPIAGRAVELSDDTLLPRGVSVEDLRFAKRPEIQAINEATPGSGEARLIVGEGTSPAGNPVRVVLDEEGTLVSETVNPESGTVLVRDAANPRSSNMFGEREFDNGFTMPITRAEGKPLRFNPETGTSIVRFTPAERGAMAQAFQSEADPTQIGRFLESGDQVLTAQEGRVLSSVLNRQLETKMLEIEELATLNDPAGFAQSVSEFQQLQKAASKLDVYRDPIDAIVDDLKQIKVIENKQAIRRAEAFTNELRIDAKTAGRGPGPMNLVDPDAVAIEQSIVGIGSDEFGDSVTKLASIGKSIDEQLESTVAKLHSHLNQGGMSFFDVKPQAVGRITREIKRQLPDAHVVVHKKSPHEHWMLVAGDEIRGPKALVKEDLTIEQRALIDGLVDGDEIDIGELIKIIEADVPGELAGRPFVHESDRPGRLGVFQDFRGTQVIDSDLDIGRIGIDTARQEPFGTLSTLVHEYAHAIYSMQVTQNARRFPSLTGGETFSAFWGGRADDFDPKVWQKMFDRSLVTTTEEEAVRGIQSASEVVKLTAYIVGIKNSLKKAGTKLTPSDIEIGLDKALRNGARTIANDPGYYLGANELHARAIEMIFVYRKMAERIAPNVTKMYLEWIGENSPKMQAILNNKRLARIDEILNEVAHNQVIELQSRRQFFGELRTSLNAAERAQFRSDGFFTGMTVRYAGKHGFVVGKKNGKILIQDFWSDRTFRVNALSSSNITSNREIAEGAIKSIRSRLHDPPQLDIPVRPMMSTRDDLVRVITLDLQSDRWTLFDNIDEFRDAVAVNPEEAVNAKTAEELAMMSDEDFLNWAARERRAGTQIYQDPIPQIAIRHDDGFFLMADDVAPDVTPEVRARRLGEEPSATGLENLGVYRVNNRAIAESLVRQFGLNERDIPYVIDQVMNHITKDYLHGLSPKVFQGLDPKKLLKFSMQDPDDAVSSIASLGIKPNRRNTEAILSAGEIPDMALKSGYSVDESYGGVLVVRKNGEVVATGRKPVIREWLNRAGREGTELNTPELASEYHGAAKLGEASDGTSGLSFDRPASGHSKAPARPTGDGPGLGGGGGAKPPRFGETLDSTGPPDENFVSQATDVANLAMPFITGMENFAKTVEQTFGVGAYTKIFKPLQDAIRNVDRAMQAPRQGLKGKSFHDQLKDIEKLLFKIHKQEDREAITTYLEALSKQEIERAGGLMTRPMNEFEKGMSAEIERLDLAHEMPRLVSTWQLMRNAVKGRKQFMKRYRTMVNQELPPEVAERLQVLHNFVTRKRKIEFDDLVEELGLNPAQAQIINELEVIRAAGLKPKDFSLMAVMRHAAADPLPTGAKTMRQAVAKELDLSPQQLEVARKLEELFDETFSLAGIDQRRYISGYFPHMRVMAQEGILPSDAHMLNAMPREAGFSATKFRTGELDVYTREPLMAAVKHVRAMLMHEHFDPELKGVRQALRELKLKDQRAARIMQEYVYELQGRPHQSFRKLQTAIQTAAKAMGHKMNPGTARSVVNTLASLTYQSLIPFRVGLIARNYFQLAQMIPPRTGMGDFVKGLRIAMTNEGYQAARRAGALHEHVTPVHASESILGLGSTYRLSRRMQRISDVGFRWYQKADEFGRAVAYHAQQSKLSRAIDKYQRGIYGKDTSKALRKMMEEGGVRQFNPVDQREFSRLFLSGKIEEAKSHLSRVLSDETMFRYGHANHPAGWGSVYGRLFGQFGTWPVQYKDFLLQGLSRGTKADKARFLTYHIGANVGVVAAGATVGYNLESWVSFPSLWYTGGPYTNVAIDMIKTVSGSEAERGMALRNLKFQFVPTLSDPRALWIPGSYAIGDMAQMFQAEAGVDQALGFRRYKPDEDTPLDWLD